MKISLKHQTIERKNSDVCIVTEYSTNDDALDMVVVKINGRYPDHNRVTNLHCKEIVYVQAGQGEVVVEDKHYALHAGDVVLIEPGEKYYWQGSMQLLIACNPAWTKDQHQSVE